MFARLEKTALSKLLLGIRFVPEFYCSYCSLSIASVLFYSWPTLGLSVDFCWELPAPPLGMFQFTQKLYIEPKINQVAKHVFTSLAPTLVVVVTRIASLCLNLFFLNYQVAKLVDLGWLLNVWKALDQTVCTDL